MTINSMLKIQKVYICYLPTGRSVLIKTVPEVLCTARGNTEGTVFLITFRPRPAIHVLIFFLGVFKRFNV